MLKINDMLDKKNYLKIKYLENESIEKIIFEMATICKPEKILILNDSDEDTEFVRNLALSNGEERKLKNQNHTIHYDGYDDQGRDKQHTRVLLPKGKSISKHINTIEKQSGLKEIYKILENSMMGKKMLVRFFCLGPLDSKFSISAMQITDSAYVAHSENILYRSGYEQFKKLKNKNNFFHFVHSAGALNEAKTSINIDKRRIYIDLEGNRVLSVNNQYAGNSLGLKKLALRLAIHKANNENWLSEHMFIMGVHPENKTRTTYFCGAFPSACGKTSTAMIPGQTIIGDDIVYLKIWENGECHAANIESGIFGIIKDVNPKDDPVIYKYLNSSNEIIFSNVLESDGSPYWLGMGKKHPQIGINHSGKWFEGKRDSRGNLIPLSHKNARYTINLKNLENVDPFAENKDGVPVKAIVYGGRDSDTNVPIAQSLSWNHGVFLGASLESETTSATIGEEGKRKHSPMANLDFIVVPLNKYFSNHFKFGIALKSQPIIFSTNYFLKNENGDFLNSKKDKKAWILWAEGRVHNEYKAIKTPVGFIPLYKDIAKIFKNSLNKEYTRQEYEKQFTLRIDNLIAKNIRIQNYFSYTKLPEQFYQEQSAQEKRLNDFKKQYNKNNISPFELDVNPKL